MDIEAASRRILVVEDDPAIRRLIATIFQQSEYGVLESADAEDAIRLIHQTMVGVAVIDKNLPGKLGGLDVLRTLASVSPNTKSIIVTAHASTESAIEALRLGGFDYVSKPLRLDSLREKVDAASRAFKDAFARSELLSEHSALFETLPGFVWFMTEGGVFKRINRSGAQLLGYEPEDLIGESYDLLLSGDPTEPEIHWGFLDRRRGDRATRRLRVQLQHKSGERRVFELYAGGAYNDPADDDDTQAGGFFGTVGVALDVTERVNLEDELRQAQKMEAIGRLAGGVAHDFNNLLSVIMTNAQLARESMRSGEDLDEDIDGIAQAAERAAELTHQLLAFARKRSIKQTTVDIASILDDLTTLLERLIGEDIAIDLDLEPEPGLVEADAAQLRQVVLNLAANARDAMPGGGTMTVGLHNVTLDAAFTKDRSIRPGPYVMLSVSDTGTGMTPEVRERIFEPFYTTKDGEKGTGLGLTTVYTIVQQNSGHVSIYSEESVGTSVKIYLPRVDGVAEQAQPEATTANEKESGTILLVEDEPLVRAAGRRALRSRGYEVFDAADGEEGLEAFDELGGKIDILVTDVVMPRMNGPELARILRQRKPELVVVYMSGYLGNIRMRHEMLETKAEFLQKPFVPETLIDAIRRASGA